MKKYLKASAWFAGAGLLGGVFFREFTKFNGMQGQYCTLGFVHVHFLSLGVLAMLLFGLIDAHLHPAGKLNKSGFTLYTVGTAGAGACMWVRGTLEILAKDAPLAKGLDAALSGIAGLFHIALGLGMVFLLISWIKACRD